MYLQFSLYCILSWIASTTADVNNDEDALTYLRQYGWSGDDGIREMIDTESDESDTSQLSSALLQFQEYYGLSQTGRLDNATLELMHTPRCGVPDRGMNRLGRNKRYTYLNLKHTTDPITYTMENYSPDLPRDQQDKKLNFALREWRAYANLNFNRVASGGLVSIRFAAGEHGDGRAFDSGGGLRNVLAHAGKFMLHLDEWENWAQGNLLYNVLLHEWGHVLGLDHTRIKGAVMNAYYREELFQLHSDDIDGIRSLYGARGCGSDEFTCTRNAKCIPVSWKCDNDNDCDDNSDEAACTARLTPSPTPSECGLDQYRCSNTGRCIFTIFKCDGDDDCGNNEDEDNCVLRLPPVLTNDNTCSLPYSTCYNLCRNSLSFKCSLRELTCKCHTNNSPMEFRDDGSCQYPYTRCHEICASYHFTVHCFMGSLACRCTS